METYLSEKNGRRLIILCWLAYTTAYLGRLNFSASLVEIIDSFGTTKAAAGLVASFFFFAYGAGQLINGFLSRRYNPRIAIAAALTVSAALNVAMTFAGGVAVMKYIWLCNGLAQSVLWSTLIHTLGVSLPGNMLKRAILVMSTTAALGTALSYGMTALAITVASWRWAFYVGAAIMLAVAAVWFTALPRGIAKGEGQRHAKETGSGKKARLTPVFLFELAILLLLAIFTNFIKDGLTTWTPDILFSMYSLPKALSIILTLTLPLIAVSGAFFSVRASKWIKNHVSLCGVFFAIAFVATGALFLLINYGGWILTLGGFALTVCAVSAVNNVITSMVPLAWRDRLDSGFTAGLLNSFCYIGSTLSSVLLGLLADARGWNGVFVLLLLLTGAAIFVCAATAMVRKAHGKKEGESRVG
ncbi:MAG: MFS transporter [Clostridia bacterium]|nr:MFS transporter [Clostridia bacterium]